MITEHFNDLGEASNHMKAVFCFDFAHPECVGILSLAIPCNVVYKTSAKKKKNNKTCGCNLSDDRQSRKLVFRLFIPLLERVHEIVFLFSIAFFLGLFLFEVKAFLAGPLPMMSLQTHVDIIVQPIILTSMYSNHLQQLFTQVTPGLVIYDA